MLSTLHRILPFLARGNHRKSNRNSNADRDTATSRPQNYYNTTDDYNSSAAWSTLRSDDLDDYKDACRVEDLDQKAKGERRTSILSNALTTFSFSRPKSEFVVEEDISNGRERFRIPAMSYKRNDSAPKDYSYVTEHVWRDNIYVDLSLSNITCCRCVDDCSSGRCSCSAGSKTSRRYNARGRLRDSYDMDSPEVIYECNDLCKCNAKLCQNTVIQKGCKLKLVLFKTKSRGWGIRTLDNLKKGTFVGSYTGELITAADSLSRNDDTYLFNLAPAQVIYQQQQHQESKQTEKNSQTQQLNADEQQVEVKSGNENVFVCDAKYYGNFTRFINHSCEPNVIGIRSFTRHNDHRFPYISFFTYKDIPANSELTLHYGDNYWLVKTKRDGVYCRCKKSKCRFTRKTFPDTLRQHNRERKLQHSQQRPSKD